VGNRHDPANRMPVDATCTLPHGPHAVAHILVTGSESLAVSHNPVATARWPLANNAASRCGAASLAQPELRSTGRPADYEVRCRSDIWAVLVGNLILPFMPRQWIAASRLLPVSTMLMASCYTPHRLPAPSPCGLGVCRLSHFQTEVSVTDYAN
jgi:hypothetical protein